jgi:hypothetical protein
MMTAVLLHGYTSLTSRLSPPMRECAKGWGPAGGDELTKMVNQIRIAGSR